MDMADRERARGGFEIGPAGGELVRNAKKILFRRNEPTKSFRINTKLQKTNLKTARNGTKKGIKEQAFDQKYVKEQIFNQPG